MIRKNILNILTEASETEKFSNGHTIDNWSGDGDDYEYEVQDTDEDETYDGSADSVSDSDIDALISDVQEDYEDVDELEDDEDDALEYTPEMVVVVQSESGYLVELENVVKLAQAQKVNLMEALENIATADSISLDEMTVVIESENVFKTYLNEKAVGKNSKKRKLLNLKSSARFFEDVKNKGIQVKKRKPRKKKHKK